MRRIHNMRRVLGIAGLMAGLIGVTTVPAAAQGWGYAAYDEPPGTEVGVSVGGVGFGIGAPSYGAYAADYGYAPSAYGYSAAPCSCGTTAGYGYSRSYRPSYYAARSSYAYNPGYAYLSRPAYGYDSTYAYGDRVGYGSRGSRVAVQSEVRTGMRNRDTLRSASVIREGGGNVRSATMRDGNVMSSNAMMTGPSREGRGGHLGSTQAGAERQTATTGGGTISRVNDRTGLERR